MRSAARVKSLLNSASAIVLLMLGAATVYADTTALKAGVFDPPRQAPDFSLQGSDGNELRISRYHGKVVLLAFGYTSCQYVCPTTLATFAQTRRKLGAAAAGVQVVYVTVDPERDDTARLKKFLGNFDGTFVGGTGTETQLSAVRKSYGVSAQKQIDGEGYSYNHSSFTYLIDREGRIRALMPYGHSADDYVHDLTILLKE
jgi:protein SCO1/2